MIEDTKKQEVEITITCPKITPKMEYLLTTIQGLDENFIGRLDGESHIIPLSHILYFESVDRKIFIYTDSHYYESPLKLYALEQRLGMYDFIRISKSMIINIHQIQSIKPEFGSKLLLTLICGEKLYVSRQYVPILKEKLGL